MDGKIYTIRSAEQIIARHIRFDKNVVCFVVEKKGNGWKKHFIPYANIKFITDDTLYEDEDYKPEATHNLSIGD